ncbi:ABC transporter ATP-binding protein [Sorangium sp. So ce128]|uniref:ABC transporter ATP-binding protein n=1 Tax=Sorangium sp. So ce128 TaxID=3133281 RepID=UPI003F611CA1
MSARHAGPPPAAPAGARSPVLPRGPFGMGAAPPQKAKQFAPSARRLLGRLAPERARLVVVLACSLLSVGLGLAGPKLLGRATDIIFSGVIGARLPAAATKAEAVAELQRSGQARLAELVGHMDVVPGRGIQLRELAELLLLVMALYAGASLFAWLQGYLLNDVVQNTVRQLRAEAQDKLARLPLAYFDGRPHGELLSRVTNDIDNVAQGLQQTLTQIMNGALTLLGIIVMLVVISPVLAVITLFTVPLSVLTTAAVAKRAQAKFVAQWAQVGVLNGQIEEAFTGHSLVNVLGRRRDVEARFQSTNQELFETSFRAQFMSSIIMPAVNFVGNLTYVAIAVVGGLRVASGAMLLGSVQAFIQYSRQFSQQLGQLASVTNVLQSGVASAERVFELLDEQGQSPDATPPAALPKVSGEVRFEHVTFRYKPDEPLIEDLDLTILPGQTVAIVGPTGAGKTTLVNLLMRFYELDGGRILIDGVDIARLPRHELRARFGIVLQDTWLFSGTIRDNIAFGNAAATEADIQEAARAAHVDRFVRALPAGYDTVIDEDSGNLSAGEKQLITIARAFLANPAILILDEATSSVDTRTEVLVQRAMAALRARRTSFVIAHRLSTIRDADMLLVMKGGRIVERGTHAELLAAGGAYHALYQTQLTGNGGSGVKLEGQSAALSR